MIERYRKDYDGEFVITDTIIRHGKKVQEREWVPDPVSVSHISKRATCIEVNGTLKDTLYKRIESNNGGNLGKHRMQVYGVEGVWRKMVPNFTIAMDDDNLQQMIRRSYTKESIVYTGTRYCLKYPGEFYLVPHGVSFSSAALAVWLACFDGHKEIFLVGYIDDGSDKQAKMISAVNEIMKTYKSTQFIHVTNNNSPEPWKYNLNFSAMAMNTYVSHCDV